MKELENKLDELLVKKAPFQIPENGRKWIAEYAWIGALVGVVLGVLLFFPLLAALGIFSVLGAAVGAGGYVLFAWISLLVMAAYLVILGMSVPKLKLKQRSGWQLTYYSMLAFFVYDVVNFLAYMGAGSAFALVWNIAGIVVALYVLFQVKDKFKN